MCALSRAGFRGHFRFWVCVGLLLLEHVCVCVWRSRCASAFFFFLMSFVWRYLNTAPGVLGEMHCYSLILIICDNVAPLPIPMPHYHTECEIYFSLVKVYRLWYSSRVHISVTFQLPQQSCVPEPFKLSADSDAQYLCTEKHRNINHCDTQFIF